uniref:N-acetyltransferase domain-containing protein n=1 Tax=Candidatus Kentrum sp. TUN TaxID=2126343 RepID=A0A451A144_9GAMM|nr:MAG: hypothetical protein BECKTUN1418D_GA0071000_11082 [Candidatus Kentron sp. TUN]
MTNNGNLILRVSTMADVDELRELHLKTHRDEEDALRKDEIIHLMDIFPYGNLVAVFNNRICGHSVSVLTKENELLKEFSWYDRFYGHDPNGDCVYGLELAVMRPSKENIKLGHILVNYSMDRLRTDKIKKIYIGASIRRFEKFVLKTKNHDIGEYLRTGGNGRVDPVVGFYKSLGFKEIRPLKNYYPDSRSFDWALLMVS